MTRLLDLPELARRAGVARVLVKCENERMLGNFKVLGGRRAGRLALARHPGIRRLICASDGNHGLAVALAAREAGADARVYLPSSVSGSRASRIRALGAEIVRIEATYDVAVEQAAAAAARGEGLLIPDTTSDPEDPVVADVMDGYRTITDELAEQFAVLGIYPTHLFVQAGVGGLAASLAEGLSGVTRAPVGTVVVEPETCACVGSALAAGRPVMVGGELRSDAGMLSCGLASAPAVTILQAHGARAITVSEDLLTSAPGTLAEAMGPASTPSGAAGLAGLLSVADNHPQRITLGLDTNSIVLLVATEGPPGLGDFTGISSDLQAEGGVPGNFRTIHADVPE